MTGRKEAGPSVESKEPKEALVNGSFEDLFKTTIELSPDIICITDLDGRIRFANTEAARVHGVSDAQELVGVSGLSLVAPEDLECAKDNLVRLLETGIQKNVEYTILRANGSSYVGELSAARVDDEGGRPSFLTVVIRDTTQRKRAEVAVQQSSDEQKRAQGKLEEYQGSLRRLASRLTVAEEQERRRIASGLHDSAAQDLVGAAMRLRQLKEDVDDQHELSEALAEIHALVHRTSRELRTLSLDLSPPLLFNVGLEAAIDGYASRFRKDHRVSCTIIDDGQPKPLGNDARALLYRCTCELLANAAKHSRADTVRIEIERMGHEIVLCVADNGKGFQVPRPAAKLETKIGFGLFSVQERLRPLGGDMQVESEVGRGTRVTLRFPITPERTGEEEGSA